MDVGEVLRFMRQILTDEKFWKERYKKKSYNYRRWMISQIVDFVSDILRDKDRECEEGRLKEIKRILLLLAKKTKSERPSDGRLIDSYINDSRGKVFEALVEYAWQYARRFKGDETVQWEEDVKNIFENGLAKRGDWCLYVTIGRYLPQFMRLDKNWTEQNIARLFPMDDLNTWKVSFAGYLNIHTLYTELYDLMKTGKHYEKAIATDFEDEWTNNYLVHSIGLAYMLGLDDLEETGLMNQFVFREDSSQLNELVNYICGLRETEYENKSEKVKDLWRILFGIFNNHTTDSDFQQMIISIGEWLGLVDDIDGDVEEWMKFTIDHVSEAWQLNFFVENLLNHVGNEPERVANIYVYLLDQKRCPDFPEDKIIELVESLYLKETKQKADIICNMYLKAGHEFLIPVFQKYQQQ